MENRDIFTDRFKSNLPAIFTSLGALNLVNGIVVFESANSVLGNFNTGTGSALVTAGVAMVGAAAYFLRESKLEYKESNHGTASKVAINQMITSQQNSKSR